MRELEKANGNAALNEAELCRLRAERTTLRCLHAITIPFPFSEPNVRTLNSVALTDDASARRLQARTRPAANYQRAGSSSQLRPRATSEIARGSTFCRRECAFRARQGLLVAAAS